MNITLDTESSGFLDAYVAYVPSSASHREGVVSDAILTGLLSRWADSAGTIPIEDLVRSEAAREVVLDGPSFELDFAARGPNDQRVAADHKAQALAAVWGVDVATVFLAAARVGLAKFNATINIQTGRVG